MKILSLIALLTIPVGLFAQTPAPKTQEPAPTAVTQDQLPIQVQILILQQQVASLQAELKHVHEEDINQIFQWLKFFKAENDRVHSQSADPLRRDQSQDKF